MTKSDSEIERDGKVFGRSEERDRSVLKLGLARLSEAGTPGLEPHLCGLQAESPAGPACIGPQVPRSVEAAHRKVHA